MRNYDVRLVRRCLFTKDTVAHAKARAQQRGVVPEARPALDAACDEKRYQANGLTSDTEVPFAGRTAVVRQDKGSPREGVGNGGKQKQEKGRLAKVDVHAEVAAEIGGYGTEVCQ